jgi:hypothetical protein
VRGVTISRSQLSKVLRKKRGFRWRRPRHTLKGRQDPDAIDRVGFRLKLRKAQAEAGDIVLLFCDESEALTHPYLARAWAKRGADLRVPAPRLYGPKPGMPIKPVVIVLDNGPIHVSKATLAALAERAHWLTIEWLAEICARAQRKPSDLSRRQSLAPFRQPPAHWASSSGRCASSELCRVLNTSPLSPRMTWRTQLRLWPVLRTIRLIAAPPLASAKMVAIVSSRRK